jgi:hypothetical protein
MSHRFTVIFEKEDEGGLPRLLPHSARMPHAKRNH